MVMSLIEACKELIGLEIECEESAYGNFKITNENINVLKYFMPARYKGQYWHTVAGIYLGMGVHMHLYYNGNYKLIKVFGTLGEKSTIVDVYTYDPVTRKILKNLPSPVINSIIMGHYDLVHAMLHKGMDPEIMTEYGTPLLLAIKHGRIRIIRDLLRWGAECDEKTLHAALNTHNIEIIKALNIEMTFDILEYAFKDLYK